MNMLRSGIAWLEGVRKASMSDAVTYTRPNFAPLALQATPADPDFAIDDGVSVKIAGKHFDWIITASDLVLGGHVALPARGDKLVPSAGAFAGRVFEVQVPDSSTMPYEFDATGQQLTIHTKKIA